MSRNTVELQALRILVYELRLAMSEGFTSPKPVLDGLPASGTQRHTEEEISINFPVAWGRCPMTIHVDVSPKRCCTYWSPESMVFTPEVQADLNHLKSILQRIGRYAAAEIRYARMLP